MSKGDKIPRKQAQLTAERFKRLIGPRVARIHFCGSLRRGKLLCGDLDVVAECATREQVQALTNALRYLWGSLKTKPLEPKRAGTFEGVPVQVLIAGQIDVGSAILMATGSSQFNIAMRGYAKARGYKLNRYGLWKDDARVCIAPKEIVMFASLGLRYVEPRDRKDGSALACV